jgi:hypothetical protein
LETVVALAILSAAIVGPMSLVSSGIIGLRASKNRAIASYLAEEGVEIIRGIKENNALVGKTESSGTCNDGSGTQWDEGLCSGVWRADIEDFVLLPDDGTPLLFDPGQPGLYGHQSGNPSIFTRTVAIASLVSPADDEDASDAGPGLIIPAADILDVVVTVSWREGLGTREIRLYERFYNWQ